MTDELRTELERMRQRLLDITEELAMSGQSNEVFTTGYNSALIEAAAMLLRQAVL